MTEAIPIHDSRAVDRLRSELRIEPGLVRRMRIAFFKKFLGREAALGALPSDRRESFAKRVRFHTLSVEKRCDSETDGATKLIFRTRSDYLIESVLLRANTGRTSLCLSSQIGCAAHCDFCATGKMGMAHNLAAGAILDQVVQANEQLRDEGRQVRNLVFMGMGEPLHNEEQLYASLAALTDPARFDHPANRILVSTVGIPNAMQRLARRFPQVNQALSLHSVRQETREKLAPLTRRYRVDDLRRTLVTINAIQKKSVMLEYLLMEEVNDSLEEARELAAWVEGLLVHVNLIPYNPIAEAPHLAPTPAERRKAFAQVLKDRGVPTTTRYSMGQDIDAACGQLVQQGNREVAKRRAYARGVENGCVPEGHQPREANSPSASRS